MSLANCALARLDGSSKRKRQDANAAALDERPLTIRPAESEPLSWPLILTPLTLLSRAQLPLSYIDTLPSGSRIFTTNLSILEESHDKDDETMVLLVNAEAEKRLYAIERVQRYKYALCRLLEGIEAGSFVKCRRCIVDDAGPAPKRRAIDSKAHANPWWAGAAVDRSSFPEPQSKTNSVDSNPKQKCSDAPVDPQDRAQPWQAIHDRKDVPSATAIEDLELPTAEQKPMQLSPERVLQDLSTQYLDMLYISRTSLAYFVKGPLSRTRAAFAGTEPDMTPAHLIENLRSMLISTATMETKCKSGLPELVKDTCLALSEQPPERRKKHKWKLKRDKVGFLHDEKEYVKRWWVECDDAADAQGTEFSLEYALRTRLPKVRHRETFLQIILILEILALEAANLAKDDLHATAGAELVAGKDPSVGRAEPKKAQSKKKVDLHVLLETLLDRLCIWHSLESSSPGRASESKGAVSIGPVHDELKSFCVEVVVPFYMPRIPKIADTVNRKLGGPVASIPVKRKLFASSRPGQAVGRDLLAKGITKSIEPGGIGTKPKAAPSAPSLMRSSTDPESVLRIKREASEASLSSAPDANQSKGAPRQRRSLMHSMSFSRREVDLTAISQASEAKMRKKDEIYAKMQKAISNIRKPNRELAVEETAASIDESFARATTKTRPTKHRTKPTTQSQHLHVASTPKHHKSANPMLYQQQQQTRSTTDSQQEPVAIPSSSIRPKSLSRISSNSTFAVPQTGHRSRTSHYTSIAETPSRGFAKFMPPGLAHAPGTLDTSPVGANHSAIVQQTPSRPARDSTLLATPCMPHGIAATPVPPPACDNEAAPVQVSPNAVRDRTMFRAGDAGHEDEAQGLKSIYASLGWDEEEYEHLA